MKPTELRPLLSDWEWQRQGNCVNTDTDVFFLEPFERDATKQRKEAAAKAICNGCPVLNKCLDHALSVPEEYGVFGGMSADERRQLLIKRTK